MSEDISIPLIHQGLKTSVIGRSIRYYEHLASTMEAAKNESRLVFPEGTVIIAGIQEKGRGRLQREWRTPAGNIALSIVLSPVIGNLPYLIMMSSLSVCRSISMVTGLEAGIKWPNDVLIGGKKVCGILIENELKQDGTASAVVGIGINVGLQPVRYDDIAVTATSLEYELGTPVSRNDIVRELLNHFDRLYTSGKNDCIFVDWQGKLVTLGQPVTATWKDRSVEGIAESVDETGTLVLRLPDGSTTQVVAGDVTLRKTPG